MCQWVSYLCKFHTLTQKHTVCASHMISCAARLRSVRQALRYAIGALRLFVSEAGQHFWWALATVLSQVEQLMFAARCVDWSKF
jgi:hypothetical protein